MYRQRKVFCPLYSEWKTYQKRNKIKMLNIIGPKTDRWGTLNEFYILPSLEYITFENLTCQICLEDSLIFLALLLLLRKLDGNSFAFLEFCIFELRLMFLVQMERDLFLDICW